MAHGVEDTINMGNDLICKDCNGYLPVSPVKIIKGKGAVCDKCSEGQFGALSELKVLGQNAVFPCRNRPVGCMALVPYSELHRHEEECCMSKRLACGLPECEFYGYTLQLLEHFRSEHQQAILSGNEVVLDLDQNLQEVYLYCKNERFFYFGVDYSRSSRALFCFVLPLVIIDESDTVWFKIMVKTDEGVCLFEEINKEDKGVTASLVDFPKVKVTLVIEAMDLPYNYILQNNLTLTVPQLQTKVLPTNPKKQKKNKIVQDDKHYIMPSITSLNEGVKDSVAFIVKDLRSFKKDFRIFTKPFQAISRTWIIEMFPSYQLNKTHKFFSVTVKCTECVLGKQNIVATLSLKHPYLEKQTQFLCNVGSVCTFLDFLAYNDPHVITKKDINLEFELVLHLDPSNFLERLSVLHPIVKSAERYIIPWVTMLDEGVKDSVSFIVEDLRTFKKDFRIFSTQFQAISRTWIIEMFPSYKLNKTQKFFSVTLKCTDCVLAEQIIAATLTLKQPYLRKQVQFLCNVGKVFTFLDFVPYSDPYLVSEKKIDLKFKLVLDSYNLFERPVVLHLNEVACSNILHSEQTNISSSYIFLHSVYSIAKEKKDIAHFTLTNFNQDKENFRVLKSFEALKTTWVIEVFPSYLNDTSEKVLSVILQCKRISNSTPKEKIMATLRFGPLSELTVAHTEQFLCNEGNICLFHDFISYNDLKDSGSHVTFALTLDSTETLKSEYLTKNQEGPHEDRENSDVQEWASFTFKNVVSQDDLFIITSETFRIFGMTCLAKSIVVTKKNGQYLTLIIECSGCLNSLRNNYTVTVCMESIYFGKDVKQSIDFTYEGDISPAIFYDFMDLYTIFNPKSGLLHRDNTLSFKISFCKNNSSVPKHLSIDTPLNAKSTDTITFKHSFENFKTRGFTQRISPFFSLVGIYWYISIKPIVTNKVPLIGVYLTGTPINYTVNWSCPTKARFTITGDNLHMQMDMSHIFHQGEFQKGFKTILEWDDILRPRSGYLDDLVIEVQLTAGHLN